MAGRKSQGKGSAGEELAKTVLRSRGVQMVERIGTPVKLLPYHCPFRKRIIPKIHKVIFGEKVSGDIRGIIPETGRSVLIESKAYDKDRLVYSALRKHQPERLSRHFELGGLSLLVWVHYSGVYVMRWPIKGFKPRSSISLDQARRLDLEYIG